MPLMIIMEAARNRRQTAEAEPFIETSACANVLRMKAMVYINLGYVKSRVAQNTFTFCAMLCPERYLQA